MLTFTFNAYRFNEKHSIICNHEDYHFQMTFIHTKGTTQTAVNISLQRATAVSMKTNMVIPTKCNQHQCVSSQCMEGDFGLETSMR